ncbi:hypothetical protein EYF80_033638 [Liparis tanakae]|uniref:Uncharacterized protein n=1 Tax=Liparis tanakae TaxID=230148 RepID=A0A4Z2GTV0_9TELE|nr:hypothetical protein EYF80_033638 [Liparis tanakae]
MATLGLLVLRDGASSDASRGEDEEEERRLTPRERRIVVSPKKKKLLVDFVIDRYCRQGSERAEHTVLPRADHVSTFSPESGSWSVWKVRRGCDWFSDNHKAFSRSVVSDIGKCSSLETERM